MRKIISEKNLNIDIEIDGGINFKNSKQVKDAGANILVSGSTIFNENNGDLKKKYWATTLWLINVRSKKYLSLLTIFKKDYNKNNKRIFFSTPFYNKRLVTEIPSRFFFYPNPYLLSPFLNHKEVSFEKSQNLKQIIFGIIQKVKVT